MNVVGAGLGMSLTAINIFGLCCWFAGESSKQDSWAFRRHCYWRTQLYADCKRRLHFSEPYLHWSHSIAEGEISNFQFVSYSGLVVFGLLQLAISLHSIFRKAA